MTDTAKILRVGTYNTGDYSGDGVPAGSEKAKEVFSEVINADNVDFWALQEDLGFFNAETEETPYDAIYNSYKNYKRSGEKKYNYKAFLSNLDFGEVERIYYTGEVKYGHPWFLHTQLEFAGKDICMISLHFDWQDNEKRMSQIRQVIDFASKYEYSMILGDFNPTDFVNTVRQSFDPTYERDLGFFRDAGYNVANADKFGTFVTIIRPNGYPCDNIIVSPNIKIHNVGNIHRDWMNDHTAFWADVEIC